jgi:hypothetical protein
VHWALHFWCDRKTHKLVEIIGFYSLISPDTYSCFLLKYIPNSPQVDAQR